MQVQCLSDHLGYKQPQLGSEKREQFIILYEYNSVIGSYVNKLYSHPGNKIYCVKLIIAYFSSCELCCVLYHLYAMHNKWYIKDHVKKTVYTFFTFVFK